MLYRLSWPSRRRRRHCKKRKKESGGMLVIRRGNWLEHYGTYDWSKVVVGHIPALVDLVKPRLMQVKYQHPRHLKVKVNKFQDLVSKIGKASIEGRGANQYMATNMLREERRSMTTILPENEQRQ